MSGGVGASFGVVVHHPFMRIIVHAMRNSVIDRPTVTYLAATI